MPPRSNEFGTSVPAVLAGLDPMADRYAVGATNRSRAARGERNDRTMPTAAGKGARDGRRLSLHRASSLCSCPARWDRPAARPAKALARTHCHHVCPRFESRSCNDTLLVLTRYVSVDTPDFVKGDTKTKRGRRCARDQRVGNTTTVHAPHARSRKRDSPEQAASNETPIRQISSDASKPDPPIATETHVRMRGWKPA